MPLYETECVVCGKPDVIVRSVDERDSNLPDHCGEKVKRVLSATRGYADIQPYRSQLDGTMITSRNKHRQHLREHKCVEVGNEVDALMKQKPREADRDVRPELSRASEEVLRRHNA